jgi:hypothetical protein
MAISPHAFFQFAARHEGLLVELFERNAVDEGLVRALIERHRSADDPAPEHVRQRLEDLELLRPSPEADHTYELARPIAELLAWLLKRQRVAGAEVIRGHLAALRRPTEELERAIQGGEASTALFAARDLDHSLDSLAGLSEANREAIVSQVQDVRTGAEHRSAVERYEIVRRLMEGYLEPLRQLVEVHGPLQHQLDALGDALARAAARFTAHGPLLRGLRRASARLASTRLDLEQDLLAALNEVAPLYDRLRRESLWVRGAALALSRVRREGIAALDLDARLGIAGWRPRSLVSDEHLRARFAALVGYQPAGAHEIGAPQRAPALALIAREELRDALVKAAPVEDVLGFVLIRWADAPLRTQLRAFGRVVSGEFGNVRRDSGPGERTYRTSSAELHAWPVRLAEVAS